MRGEGRLVPNTKRSVRRAGSALQGWGFDPRRTLRRARAEPNFRSELAEFRRLSADLGLPVPERRDLHPQLFDRDHKAGSFDRHYFHQDLWAARRVMAVAPREHVDIGSRLDGFISHLLVFREVTMIDIRPLDDDIAGLNFVQGNATTLEGVPDDSVESLSSLHAVEHFGLGRYGDPIDPAACYAALENFARVVKPGGRLYLSLPVGRHRVEFNAHRVIDPGSIIEACAPLELLEFSAVDDSGTFAADQDPEEYRDAHYACGMFEFTKAIQRVPS